MRQSWERWHHADCSCTTLAKLYPSRCSRESGDPPRSCRSWNTIEREFEQTAFAVNVLLCAQRPDYTFWMCFKRGGMHTLCLLDIKVKEPDFDALAKGKLTY